MSDKVIISTSSCKDAMKDSRSAQAGAIDYILMLLVIGFDQIVLASTINLQSTAVPKMNDQSLDGSLMIFSFPFVASLLKR